MSTMGSSSKGDEFTWCVSHGQAKPREHTHARMPLTSHTACSPTDPNTGYPFPRRVLYEMFCNPTGLATDPLVVNSVSDNATCAYVVSMTHKLGCGAPTPCKLDGF